MVTPTGDPEFGAARTVSAVSLLKTVVPKFPEFALKVPGPSSKEPTMAVAQWITIVVELLETVPPDEVPMNMPVAPSVTSVTTRSKLNGLKIVEAVVPQPVQVNRKSPRLRPDGVPVAAVGFGVNNRED